MDKYPFLIAEISANHCGDFQLAKKLIKCAKDNGANAVKLQTYTADSMTLKLNSKNFIIKLRFSSIGVVCISFCKFISKIC